MHYHTPNEFINFAQCRVKVVTETTDLQALKVGGQRIVSGVSGFGFGGTNAHLVFEEWSPADEEARPRATNKATPSKGGHFLVPITSHSEANLQATGAHLQ